MATIEEVSSTLNELSVDPTVIRDIVAILEQGAQALDSSNVTSVPDGAFGPGGPATELSLNTAKAHRHIKEAMDAMVAGLHGYTHNVKDFAERAGVADDDSAAQLKALQQSTACVATPNFAAPGTCTLPTDGGE